MGLSISQGLKIPLVYRRDVFILFRILLFVSSASAFVFFFYFFAHLFVQQLDDFHFTPVITIIIDNRCNIRFVGVVTFDCVWCGCVGVGVSISFNQRSPFVTDLVELHRTSNWNMLFDFCVFPLQFLGVGLAVNLIFFLFSICGLLIVVLANFILLYN